MQNKKNVFFILKERGFIEQVTDERKTIEVLDSPITCYIGFDPTAQSFHVGNLVPLMALAHMQSCGHRPIVVMGGGTGLIGDPSGKQQMRQLLSEEEIETNLERLKQQVSRFIDFSDSKALMLNNAKWLKELRYLDFLRDIGRHFSVNKMLSYETYKKRLETGLNFIEFNYMLLQAYDFLYLYRNYNCILQMGGNDQWGNILAGIDLVRRLEGTTVYGITFPLITTASGAKMGKTERGAIWLDAKRTSPYEFYQYWINVDDKDVEKFLRLFTFLPLSEIERFKNLKDKDIREAKEILAFETTKIIHGEEEAKKVRDASYKLFYQKVSDSDSIPTTFISQERLKNGIPAFVLFREVGLCSSGSEARRLIQSGGAYINEKKVKQFDQLIGEQDIDNRGIILLRVGKKNFHRILVNKS